LSLVDLVCSSKPAETELEAVWIKNTLLAELTVSYRKLDLDVTWDDSITRWLTDEYKSKPYESQLERLADEQITPAIMRFVNDNSNRQKSVTVLYHSDAVIIK